MSDTKSPLWQFDTFCSEQRDTKLLRIHIFTFNYFVVFVHESLLYKVGFLNATVGQRPFSGVAENIMAEKYAGKLHIFKEDAKEKWVEFKEKGIQDSVKNNVQVTTI